MQFSEGTQLLLNLLSETGMQQLMKSTGDVPQSLRQKQDLLTITSRQENIAEKAPFFGESELSSLKIVIAACQE